MRWSCRIPGMRRALTWGVVLPLIVVGSQIAHGLAYWWAYPITDVRVAILVRYGHGYLAYAPIALSFLGALELLALGALVVDRVRGGDRRRLPLWVFLWLPMLGFVVQEFAERWFAVGRFPTWAVHEPTFWRGLVLQAPIGIAGYLAARALLGAARVVAEFIGQTADGFPVGAARPVVPEGQRLAVLPRRAPLAFGAAGRAPPVVVAVLI